MRIVTQLAGLLMATAAVPALAATPAEKLAAAPMAAASAPLEFEVYLPLRNTDKLEALLAAQQTAGSPSFHKWLTPAQFKQQFGPTAASIARVRSALAGSGLAVTRENARSVHVRGNAAQAGRLFGTSFRMMADGNGRSRLQATSFTLPAALKAEGATVLAFDGKAISARPFTTRAQSRRMAGPANRYSDSGPYWFTDLKQAYDYPSYQSLDGTGVKVAILMSGNLYPDDVPAFFNHEHFSRTTGKPVPQPAVVPVNGGGVVNSPDGGDFEAALDVQQVLGGAPGASVTQVSIPSLSDRNIIAGYTEIVNSNAYDIVSSSFGECELYYTAPYNDGEDFTTYLKIYDELFKQGNAQGITFLASSGDEAGLQCLPTGYFGPPTTKKYKYIAGVSTPAASPFVTAVGGTNLVTTYSETTLDSSYVGENSFGDPEVPQDPFNTGNTAYGGYWGAGGGLSRIERKPAYQSLVTTGSTFFRAVPDIGMQVGGCPGSAVQPCGPQRSAAVVAYDYDDPDIGGFYGVIGTSVSSPEFAGALALYEQKEGLKRQGNFNPYLYHFGATQTKLGGVKAPAQAAFFHRNIPGFNGLVTDTVPSSNYNYMIGNGTPDVRKLFGMTNLPPAGLPQTPSNP